MKDKQWVASRTRTTWKDGRQPETNYDHSWGPFVVELPFNSDLQGCFNDPLLATNFLADTEAKNPYDTAKARFRVEMCKALIMDRDSGRGPGLQVSEACELVSERLVDSSAHPRYTTSRLLGLQAELAHSMFRANIFLSRNRIMDVHVLRCRNTS